MGFPLRNEIVMPTAIFRADATAAIGGGHVYRCLALADVLAAWGWECVFATVAETRALVPSLAAGHTILDLPAMSVAREPAYIGSVIGRPASLLVVDHYQRGGDFETACRSWAGAIFALDDLPQRRHDVDLLLDQSGGRSATDYDDFIPPRCTLLLGPRYAMLRPTFRQIAERAGEGQPEHAAPRIFVSLGATDPARATIPVVRTIRDALPTAAIDILLAAGAPSLSAAADMAAHDERISLHVDPPDVAEIMAQADLAVGAAGINLWERCVLGLPSLLVVVAENQRANALHVAEAGGGIVVGEGGHIDHELMRETLVRLIRHPDALQAMKIASRNVCDGHGAERVADVITKTLGVDGLGTD